jgi:hypothetical protein
MLEGYLHARQEMSVVLNAPGLPAHKAPIVTAKQVRVCGGAGNQRAKCESSACRLL